VLAQRQAKWRVRHPLRPLKGAGGADLCGLRGLDIWDSCDPGRCVRPPLAVAARTVVADMPVSADPQHTCISLVAITAVGLWLLSDAFGCVEQLSNRLTRDLVGFLVGKVGI